LRELGVQVQGQDQPITIFEDNQSMIALAKNPVHHARSKHIDVQHHFIRDKIQSKEIEVKYAPSEEMIADVMTKPLPGPKFAKFVELLRLQRVKDNTTN